MGNIMRNIWIITLLGLTLVTSIVGLRLQDFADLKFDPKDVVTNELSTPVDENAIKDYLNDWSKEWSINVNKQDARAMADSYTDDAVYIEEGKAEASTKADILQEYKNWFDLGARGGALWVGGHGPIGDSAIFVWGKYTVGNVDASLGKEYGKFVTILKRVQGAPHELKYKVYRDFVFH